MSRYKYTVAKFLRKTKNDVADKTYFKNLIVYLSGNQIKEAVKLVLDEGIIIVEFDTPLNFLERKNSFFANLINE